jgi:hypothetical protein
MNAAVVKNEEGKISGIDWGDVRGNNLVLGAELRNAGYALERRQQYLLAEKTLSEREK